MSDDVRDPANNDITFIERRPLLAAFLGDGRQKGILQRSGVRTFLAAFLSVVIVSWSKDENVVQAIKDAIEFLLPAFLTALGLANSKSYAARP